MPTPETEYANAPLGITPAATGEEGCNILIDLSPANNRLHSKGVPSL